MEDHTFVQRLTEHMAALGLAANTDLAAQLIAAYREPHRHYHNLSHIAFVLDEIDRQADWIGDIGRLRLAAWFHDAVYDTHRRDNEEKSAVWATSALREIGLQPATVDRVAALIRATAVHQDGGSDADDDLFLDIDFSILGSPPQTYDRYAEAIRAEYGWAPGLLYRRGRRAFLRDAIKAPRIFLTEEYETRLGPQARDNMRRELARLGG